MNKLQKLGNCFAKTVDTQAPTLLTIIGVGTMVATVIFACKATKEAIETRDEIINSAPDEDVKELRKEVVKKCAPYYIPTLILGSVSIGCVIGSNSISTKRTAALAAAYSLSEEGFRAYREKVRETIGEKKEQAIRDKVALESAKKNPPSNDILAANDKGMLIYDKTTGRYFRSTKDDVLNAATRCNLRLLSEMYISFNEFYDELDLPHTGVGDDLGFSTDVPIQIEWTYGEAPDGSPMCIISYDHCPTFDYTGMY